MFASDQEDNPAFDFSILDRNRIEDLSLGEKMEGESGLFEVQKINNGYCLWSILTGGKPATFSTLAKIINYLEKAAG